MRSLLVSQMWSCRKRTANNGRLIALFVAPVEENCLEVSDSDESILIQISAAIGAIRSPLGQDNQ